MSQAPAPLSLASLRRDGEVLRCTGAWVVEQIADLEAQLGAEARKKTTRLDASPIQLLDTTGALLLLRLSRSLETDPEGLKPGHRQLLELVRERWAAQGERPPPERPLGPIAELGRDTWEHVAQGLAFLSFVGEATLAMGRTLLNPGRIRWRALLANLESAGVNALPIIALLSFLMGVVIAYQGGQQLKTYGANIFIVELVSLTMLRELAPLLTAIIVAGRTGSAFTAQIGTMKVTEEIDALRTIGIDPMDLLVLPKLLALAVALPLLSLFADVMSVFGGMVMAYFLLDVSFREFLDRIPQAVTLTSFMLGIGKAPVFAAIIALVGCYQGFRVSGGADAVGAQTTVSVVQAIFLVIVADAFFSVMFGGLGI